jgi:general secretion pathway protein J
LLEVLVAVGIISLVGVLIYGAFQGMARSRTNIQQAGERYQQGRMALDRMGREIGSAFLSLNVPIDSSVPIRETIFVGNDSSSGDRLDFTSFAHLRLERDRHESDQAEISYFVAQNPDTGGLDLARRVDKYIDEEPARGGLVQVMVENIERFDVRYLDPVSN